LLQNREICEHPVGESTHLLQNREISDIRTIIFPNGAAKAQNIPKY
jgi:hypothetical protein